MDCDSCGKEMTRLEMVEEIVFMEETTNSEEGGQNS